MIFGFEKGGYDWGLQKCRSYRWAFLGREFELHFFECQGERTRTFIIRKKRRDPGA